MKIHCAGPTDTHRLGTRLGKLLPAGLFIALNGGLGAGKTSLTQGIAEGVGVADDHYVNSPTFTILQLYPGRIQLAHMDWYRISDEDEAMGLGIEEYIGSDCVCVVEWPERLPEFIPPTYLQIDISIGVSGRDFKLKAVGSLAERTLKELSLLYDSLGSST